MRKMIIGLAAAGVAALGGCGRPTACYGLSDSAAVDQIVQGYNSQPATAKGDGAQMKLHASRVVGIGRKDAPKHSGQSLIQVWFHQDDNTLTVASLSPDCTVQFRPNLTPDAIKDAVIPAKPPQF
jgi:hypothetical protein